MANVHSTSGELVPAKISYPERLAQWLSETSANWLPLFGFVITALLTVISVRFNYELGKMSAVDDVSQQLLPKGYALLDFGALFISGLLGMICSSLWRKAIAWVWFMFLVSLSLWAAASFTMSVDARLASSDLNHAIEQKKTEVESLNQEVEIWRQNVAEAVNFKTKHQNTLTQVQARQKIASDELHQLESKLTAPTMVIYEKTAPLIGIAADTLNLIIRLMWSAAITLSPLVFSLIGFAEFRKKPNSPTPPKTKAPLRSEMTVDSTSWQDSLQNWRNRRKVRAFIKKTNKQRQAKTAHELRQKNAELTENRATQTNFVAAQRELVNPIKGNNQHTEAVDLNGLNHAKLWLKEQPSGRVTRDKITKASKIKSREGVTKVISSLIDLGLIKQLANGQYIKPDRPTLQLVR